LPNEESEWGKKKIKHTQNKTKNSGREAAQALDEVCNTIEKNLG
jgi:hypothetical protein